MEGGHEAAVGTGRIVFLAGIWAEMAPVTGTGRPCKNLWVVPPERSAPLDHSTDLSGRLCPLVGTSQAGAATGAAAKTARDVNEQGSLGFPPVHACADAGRAAFVPRVCASLPSLASRRAWSWSKAGQIEGEGPRCPWDWKSPNFFCTPGTPP